MKIGAYKIDKSFESIQSISTESRLDDFDFLLVPSHLIHLKTKANLVYFDSLDKIKNSDLSQVHVFFDSNEEEQTILSELKFTNQKNKRSQSHLTIDDNSQESITKLEESIEKNKEEVNLYREGSIEIKGLREYVTRLMDVNTLEQLVYETEKLRILRYKGIKVSLIYFDQDGGFLCTKNTLRKLIDPHVLNESLFHNQEKSLKKILANVLSRPVLSNFEFRKKQISKTEKAYVLFESDSEFKNLDFFLEMLTKLLFTNFIRVLQSENLYKLSSLLSQAFQQIQNISILVGKDFEIKMSNQPDATGAKCYKYIFNQDKPCEGCPIMHADSSKSSYELVDQEYVVYTSNVRSLNDRYFLHIYESHNDSLKRESIKIQRGKLQSLGLVTSALTHELNNPLTGIFELSRELSTDFEGQVHEDFDEISKASKRCLSIIENLKNFSSKKIEFERVQLSKVIEDALTLTKLLTRNTKLNVELQEDIWISGSSTILSQAIFNIIKNSIEAMQSEGEMSIRLKSNGNYAELEFKDNGPGFPKDLNDIKLFGTQKKKEGAGYGMFLVSEFIKLHKGTLDFGNNFDKGAYFLISIPKEEPIGQ